MKNKMFFLPSLWSNLVLGVILVPLYYFLIFIPLLSQKPMMFLLYNGILIFLAFRLYLSLEELLKKWFFKKVYLEHWNQSCYTFLQKLESSFLIKDVIEPIQSQLELETGLSILWLNVEDHIQYKSENILLNNPKTLQTLKSLPKSEGFFPLDRSFQPLSTKQSKKKTFGYLLSFKEVRFFVLSPFISLIRQEIFDAIYKEIPLFIQRSRTIEEMFHLSSVSHEWELLAKVQRQFLPERLPQFDDLDLHITFEPLVNVSGDYYNVIPVDKEKTLIFLGDVSGKGLGAALIMGIVVNTIQTLKTQDSLVDIVNNVDMAIKEMQFEGKFTTLFIGIFNHKTSVLRYVNASMPELKLISNGNIQNIPSEIPMIGIIDLPEMSESTLSLQKDDVLLISSDGLEESRNPQQQEYGDSNRLEKILLEHAHESASQISHAIYTDLQDYVEGGKFADDLTYLVLKKV